RPTEDPHRAFGRYEDTRQHLDHRRFASAVRPQIADRFALADLERYGLDRLDLGELARHETLERAPYPREPPVLAEALAHAIRFDDGRHGSGTPRAGRTGASSCTTS